MQVFLFSGVDEVTVQQTSPRNEVTEGRICLCMMMECHSDGFLSAFTADIADFPGFPNGFATKIRLAFPSWLGYHVDARAARSRGIIFRRFDSCRMRENMI